MKKLSEILYITYNGVSEPIFQSQCLPYLKGLSGKGHVITLLSYERDLARSLEYAHILKRAGIKWYRLRYHKYPRFLATAYDFLAGIALSFFATLKNRPDIIHARATHGAIIGILPALITGRKFIFDTRGMDSEEYVDGSLLKKGSLIHRALFESEKYLLLKADSVVFLSVKAEELMREKGLGDIVKGKSCVIPCATDLDFFKFRKKAERKEETRFIYAGSVGTWYMMDEMLEFLRAAKKRLGKSKFFIFTQSGKEGIRKTAKKLKITDSVKIAYVPHGVISRRIADCDAGLCFIKPVSSKRASSPVKIGEYLASGVPVVINKGIGDTEGVIKKERVGVITDGFSPADYVKALDELELLLGEKDIRQRCRRAAEKYFSLERAVEAYDRIYSNLREEPALP